MKYYQKESYSEYDCNEPLLEHAVLSATSQLRERGPENARLNGKYSRTMTDDPPMLESLKLIDDRRKRLICLADLLLATSCIQPEEKNTLQRFVFRDDFNASLIGRLMMRRFVQLATDLAYDEIKFERDSKGKPFLKNEGVAVDFNVSHQGRYAVLAGMATSSASSNSTKPSPKIGVDVMKIEYSGGKPLDEFFRLMTRNFSDDEWRYIRGRSDENAQLEAFMRNWCLKESYVKNVGVGITVDLRKISFRIQTEVLARDRVVSDTTLRVNSEPMANWRFEESLIDRDHCVAVSLENVPAEDDLSGNCFELIDFKALVEGHRPLLAIDENYCEGIISGYSWTAQQSDFDQQFIIDLGDVRNITRIETQGRPHSNEYLTEYSISYGFNGLDYIDYREPGGNTKVKPAVESVHSVNTYFHFLTIDMGERKMVRKVATAGRATTSECVTEYIVQYSDDGELWKSVTDSNGEEQLFKGNRDGDAVRMNSFEVPIIAQWVRINPTRWQNRISLRAELYGCRYESESIYFNGTGLVRYDLLRDPIAATRESIRFRFKTAHPNGVLLYSRGTQGDYFALQIKDNRMVLNVDLGAKIMTSLSVGSLLDDNIWHDVVISRNRRDIIFSVDRVIVQRRIKGEFDKLNLNREFYIGGVPNLQEGLVIQHNFTGCIENLHFNATNFIREMKDAFYDGEHLRYRMTHVTYNCPEPPINPVTFLTRSSHAKLKGYYSSKQFNVSFAFRTYEEKGLMLHHDFLQGSVQVFLEDGKVKVRLKEDNLEHNPGTILDNYEEQFNDGNWHHMMLTIKKNSLVLSIDDRPMETTKLIDITTGTLYYIGGGKTKDGFVGCMRSFAIDGNYRIPTDWKEEEYCCKGEILFDACHMVDRCNPNPCKHNGICKQNSMEFTCDCAGTGYAGAVCHTPMNALSCQAFKNVHDVKQKQRIEIDVDGSGPLAPFPVTCEFYSDGQVVTVLSHSSEHTTRVDGFAEPGSFEQNIIYEADLPQIEALLNRSTECWQTLTYACRSSRLFNSPSEAENFRPYAWWVSRHNQPMDYWAGALPGSRKCQCGVVGNCIDPTKWCNCDSNSLDWQEDGGDIREKEYLPVRGLRFGDTGTPVDEKLGRYTLGPLRCSGDSLFNNEVTFRIADATIDLPPFDMGHSGDIYFEFKTTIENAVLLHARGPTDFIRLDIVGGTKLLFEYQAGTGTQKVYVEMSNKLNDDRWHSVSVERNRKEARLVVDGSTKAEVREPPGPVRALHLNSTLTVGARLDYRDGYVGCIRALLLNGEAVDLRSYAERGLYGVSPGCVGRCESNPCLNNGTCTERYDGFSCDCRWSSFKGPICADEIGVNMRSSSMIKYDFQGAFRSTLSEHIRVGFTTTNPKGFLLGLFSNITQEYLTLMVSNSGHLKVVFDFGFERQELIYPVKHFGLGQYHDVRFSRKNSGSTVVLTVDNYEPQEYHFDIKDSADAQFNNVEYMYIGKNESMKDGFVGCISRVEFDDIYPLKFLFQESPPPNVRSLGTPLTEDFCGVEPVTHPPIEIETRPPPLIDEDRLRDAYGPDTAILGSVLAIILLLLILMAILIGRYMNRHKGEYLTQEDKGAEAALDPDEAVVQSTTGHQVTKRKEFFI
uniref:L-aminoadipate-semialdehyde dehydrogenase-phosphopantetheinyl transferase n=1 Tax=Anopheles stephensi TaxID=30069 RepID=A0A182XZ17_ANOST